MGHIESYTEIVVDYGVLFCCDYFTHSQPDSEYAVEYAAATALGLETYLFDFDAFVAGGEPRLRPSYPSKPLIYRGWMLTVEQYARLHAALLQQGVTLVTSPEEYENAHHLPTWYHLVEPYTARSVWSRGIPDDYEKQRLLKNFDHQPLIVKDYVKSRKHEWNQACFIPDSSDLPNAERIIDTFIERQGSDLAGGVVLRQYVPLTMIGHHPVSGMPLSKEVRVFCFRHHVAAHIAYWSGDPEQDIEGYAHLIDAAQCVNSPFFTIDLAQKKDGDWMIIEIGDGGVSGLQGMDPNAFYTNLAMFLSFKPPLDTNNQAR